MCRSCARREAARPIAAANGRRDRKGARGAANTTATDWASISRRRATRRPTRPLHSDRRRGEIQRLSAGSMSRRAPAPFPDAQRQADRRHPPVRALPPPACQAALRAGAVARRSCTRLVSPCVRRRRLIPLSPTSTRSTRIWTMHAFSARKTHPTADETGRAPHAPPPR
jgi:hypothetical protein